MKQFLEVMQEIKDHGFNHSDRTGTGRRSIHGVTKRFNLKEGFPIVTTRKIFTKAILFELKWFLMGTSFVKYLQDNEVKIWDKWAVREEHIHAFIDKYMKDDSEETKKFFFEGFKDTFLGSIGTLYGTAWRNAPCAISSKFSPDMTIDKIASDKQLLYLNEFEDKAMSEMDFNEFIASSANGVIDQMQVLLTNLKERPYSARHIVSTWIPEFIPYEDLTAQENVMMMKGALAPCHVLQQYFVKPPETPGGKMQLSLLMYQRSTDVPVGAPYNIAQYSLLLTLIAQVMDMEAHEFIWMSGDTHIYLDQLPLIDEQLSREPLPLCEVRINPELKDLFKFQPSDVEIINYQSHSKIDYPVSV